MTSIVDEPLFISICLEGFLYGLYSGIFAIYLKCPSRSGKALVLFYALCLLYVLSVATFVTDFVAVILQTRLGNQASPLQIDSLPALFRITIIQCIVTGCCDFLAQCILIYRCWIVWGQDIRVVIIPSLLAIAYLATWLVVSGETVIIQDQIVTEGFTMTIASLTASMAVNALVTGLIVFKILKVFFEVNSTLVELTLDSTGATNLRHVVFVIIESGMTLFAIQVIRLVLTILPMDWTADYAIVIHEMLNGIAPTIILVRVSMRLSFDDPESFKEAIGSRRFNNPPIDPNASINAAPTWPPLLWPGDQ